MTHTKTKKGQKTGEETATISTGNNPYNVEFLPMVKSNRPVDLLPLRENNYFGHSLKKGKYDIDYVINLLKIIMTKCEQMKMNPKDLQFTLWTSTQKLLAMLEVERDQQ